MGIGTLTMSPGATAPRRRRRLAAWLVAAALFCFPLLWRQLIKWQYGGLVMPAAAEMSRPVAVVFGAAVTPSGRLSTVLRDRMDAAVALYHSGAVDQILVSGDNRVDHYDEPAAMARYAISRGVPAAAVRRDGAGLRTYDTCYRARHVFGVQEAILVSQAFHLPRALFTCRLLGVDAIGVAADQRPYRAARWYELRETGASLVALWDVIWRRPATIMEDALPLSSGPAVEGA